MSYAQVGILGARSLIGSELIQLFKSKNIVVYAFSRQMRDPQFKIAEAKSNVHWMELSLDHENSDLKIEYWISLIPIWNLGDYKPLLKSFGAKKIIAFSSTSLHTKKVSTDPEEQQTAKLYQAGEADFQEIGTALGLRWTIFRPTLIYGHFDDKNIAEIRKFIKRFRFFPIFGNALGKRQPIHVKDVAKACVLALDSEKVDGKIYTISGAEILTYRELVIRVFELLNQKVWIIQVPLLIFRIAIFVVKLIPKFKKWSPAMAERMNADLIYDHADATHDFGFKPQPFRLLSADYDVR